MKCQIFFAAFFLLGLRGPDARSQPKVWVENAGSSIMNGRYLQNGTRNGKNFYVLTGSQCAIQGDKCILWVDGHWVIRRITAHLPSLAYQDVYRNQNDCGWDPPLLGWTTLEGADPTPLLTGSLCTGIESELFDDFEYSSLDEFELAVDPVSGFGFGWSVKEGESGPGTFGAWYRDQVAFSDGFLRLTGYADGLLGNTRKAEVLSEEVFLSGTFSACLNFTDDPLSAGPDGDFVYENFFLISNSGMPTYAEADFEYLSNSSCLGEVDGYCDLPDPDDPPVTPILQTVTWSDTSATAPLNGCNEGGTKCYSPTPGSLDNVDGCHILTMRVENGSATYWVDGNLFGSPSTHVVPNFPAAPMSIRFSTWFSALAQVSGERSYTTSADWIYASGSTTLSNMDVVAIVNNFRRNGVERRNTASDASLPVEVTSFRGIVNDADIVLYWTTSSEVETVGFDVQERTYGEFESAFWVPATGGNDEPADYRIRLVDRVPGKYEYRIRSIDADGSFSYSSVVEVFVDFEGSIFVGKAYPSPFSRKTRIRVSAREATSATVSLLDANGRIVRNWSIVLSPSINSFVEIDGTALASGVYFVTISGETFSETRELLLAR